MQDHLEAAGYWVVKAGGSRGAADLVAIGRGAYPYAAGPRVLLVQAKVDSATDKHRGAWWDELYNLAGRLGAVSILADLETVPGVRGKRVRLRRLAGEHPPQSAIWPLIPFYTDGEHDERMTP